MSATAYPKRLIEVDLPIKDISAHARREKSLRHGHINALHIWWARRPLGACRAVLCAALWPDPADENCPQFFRDTAVKALCDFAGKVRTDQQLMALCAKHWRRWNSTDANRLRADDPAARLDLRCALLDFIADFANWDAAAVPAFLDVSRQLTSVAQTAGRPLVFDPFAGGGAFPVEALRIGADSFASDLNPLATLLNRVVLEFVPRFGADLAEAVKVWGNWIQSRAADELSQFYPRGESDLPIAYIWARTVRCEGPDCGATVPLLKSPWLATKGKRSIGLRLNVERRAVRPEVVIRASSRDLGVGTIKLGTVTCPVCEYSTPVERVRAQLSVRHGGSQDALLLAVVTTKSGEHGKGYRSPTKKDLDAVADATRALERRVEAEPDAIPREPPPPDGTGSRGGGYRTRKYGIDQFAYFFSPRQLLQHVTFATLVREAGRQAKERSGELGLAVAACLALAADRLVDRDSAFCRWRPQAEAVGYTFGRQAIPMMWDYAESPAILASGGWQGAIEDICEMIRVQSSTLPPGLIGTAACASATAHPLPDDAAQCLATDPPYYDAVPYAELSDFFIVWLKRALRGTGLLDHQDSLMLAPRDDECVVNLGEGKDRAFFERTMTAALREARRVVHPAGIGVVVFAHKSTSGWEAQLQAMIEAGWIVTASWPIDTERPARLRAQNSAALASSVHLVCRPREKHDSLRSEDVGQWREVLTELPRRIHEWMPRLAHEGVVGADAIFACLGPALEIFSRHSRVEKASGEPVALREYLEQVWAAVAREALSLIFDGADASGLEEDARLTAMWLWTLGAAAKEPNGNAEHEEEDEVEAAGGDDEGSKDKGVTGFVLEFDAARKIAQGLGAHLEKLADVVEVKGDKARLLSVAERAKSLFGKERASSAVIENKGKGKVKPSRKQLGLFAEIEAAEKEGLLGQAGVPKVGETTLDRLHQGMILFGAGRSDALKRFLVDEGIGTDGRFWRLAQSLSALYPAGSEEKRWVDGVLARKKSLGF